MVDTTTAKSSLRSVHIFTKKEKATKSPGFRILSREAAKRRFPGVEKSDLFLQAEVLYICRHITDLYAVVDLDCEVSSWNGEEWSDLENWMQDGHTRGWLIRKAKKHGLHYPQG